MLTLLRLLLATHPFRSYDLDLLDNRERYLNPILLGGARGCTLEA